MIRIAITGPECSGKTTLAEWLKEKLFDVRLVPEYARAFLESKGNEYKYTRQDLLCIAEKSANLINKAFKMDNDAVIVDTEFYVLDIWWNEVYGGHQEEIFEMKKSFEFDLFLLCEPDLPWTYDPLRENPNDRYRLFELYKADLTRDGRKTEIVSGQGELRMIKVLEKILRRFPNLMMED